MFNKHSPLTPANTAIILASTFGILFELFPDVSTADGTKARDDAAHTIPA